MSRPLITVRTLLAQSRRNGTVTIPENALVTPAARDWLHGARVPVQAVATAPTSPRRATLYLVGDAARPDVQTVLPALERSWGNVAFHPCHGRLAGLMDAVARMCAGLEECADRRGVVVVSDGAPVSCVANRYTHVRAAILPQPSALFRLQRELGINVLILERERLSLRQILSTIDTYVNGKSSVRPEVEAALNHVAAVPAAGAQRCGVG